MKADNKKVIHWKYWISSEKSIFHGKNKSVHVLFENSEMIVVSKPAGWLSVPARDAEKTEAQVLSHELRAPFGMILPVHRLDRSTSGVMVYARNSEAQKKLTGLFEQHKVKKEYRFFASNPPSAPSIVCNDPILEKAARTTFRILKRGVDFFYASAEPRTGRFHQIRIHARNLGFPLLGDKKYGGKKEYPRTMLHAYKLALPNFGEWIAPEPEDFLQLHQKMDAAL